MCIYLILFLMNRQKLGILGKNSTNVILYPSQCVLGVRDIYMLYLILGVVTFDHLVKVVSTGFFSFFPFIINLIFRLYKYIISHHTTIMINVKIVCSYFLFTSSFSVYELNSTVPSPMLIYLNQYGLMNIYFILYVIIHHYNLFSDMPHHFLSTSLHSVTAKCLELCFYFFLPHPWNQLFP